MKRAFDDDDDLYSLNHYERYSLFKNIYKNNLNDPIYNLTENDVLFTKNSNELRAGNFSYYKPYIRALIIEEENLKNEKNEKKRRGLKLQEDLIYIEAEKNRINLLNQIYKAQEEFEKSYLNKCNDLKIKLKPIYNIIGHCLHSFITEDGWSLP